MNQTAVGQAEDRVRLNQAKFRESAEELSIALRLGVDRVQEVADAVTWPVDQVQNLMRQTREAVDQVAEVSRAGAHYVQERARETSDQLVRQTQKRPLETAATALAGGVLLGLVAGGTFRKLSSRSKAASSASDSELFTP